MNALTIECSTISTQKIAELSKANRQLNSQMMSMRTKNREFETKIQQMQQLLDEKEKLLNHEKSIESLIPSEVENLTETLDKTKKKLFEISNVNVLLKNELKMAHKCLQQELGFESMNLQQLLSGNNPSWRGRAQQITMLQNKIVELRDKLEYTDSSESSHISLRRLGSFRKFEMDALNKKLEEFKAEIEELKQKLIAFKTRNKNLSEESSNYKLKTLELMEKSKNDDDYIQALNEKISLIESESNQKITEMTKEIEQIKDETTIQIQKLKFQLGNLNETLSEKENEITSLKLTNEQYEKNLREVSGDFLFSCREMSKNDYTNMMKTLEQEKNRLVDMIKELNERLNKQSIIESNQHETVCKQRLRISRLEGKLKEYEKEKEELKAKNRRSSRVNEYSHRLSGNKVYRPVSVRSREQSIAEIDKLKFK